MPKILLSGLLAAWLAILSATANAAIPSIPAEGTVTVEQIAAAIEAVDARTDLDEETKGQIAALLRESETHVRNKLADEAAAAEFAASLENAPAETDKLRARLNEPAPAAPTLEELGIKPTVLVQARRRNRPGFESASIR